MSESVAAPRHEFEAALEMDGADSGVFLLVPFSVPEVYGVKGVLPVRGTIDGFPIRLNLTPLGDGQHVLPVKKEIRNAIGKTWTETVRVVLERDTDATGLQLPDDLDRALDRAGLRPRFDELPYAKRKELAQRIARTKKPDARTQRIEDALEIARSGRKTKQ
ncbi:YdeI/OmpD-associated family protein [Hymenobacter weizhouensis]|uniref:YdeI/OmpD-associated family protein n=1 Tax=Hymenobacter sp. YIM 151500-1 TaxID=2987689 RepID=UPI002226C586|nr:YdeI/OmpD-associated family protein [Hymenobacter sp. YIM 151500-1]UYZ63412.1 YdeI/OmpD-associated family protein [Hymenobacter sp. YIM 151500-1]